MDTERSGTPQAAISSQVVNVPAAPVLQPDEVVACPASGVQQGLWFLDRLQPGLASYNVVTAVELRGDVAWDVLQACIDDLVERHEPLRTSFGARNGAPVQIIHATATVPVVHLHLEDHSDAEAVALEQASIEAARPFDLAVAPLLRAHAMHIASDRALLVLIIHHIVSDGWSQVVLFDELGALYRARVSGQPSPLPRVPIQYADFTLWQAKRLTPQRRETQLAYWRNALQNPPDAMDLGADQPRPPVPSGRGGLETWSIDDSLTDAIRRLCRSENVTVFMVFVAALQTFLYRQSGQVDQIIGSPVAGRPRPELERTIGFFANTVSIRTSLAGNPTFRELLARVRSAALGAYENQDVPFFEVVQAVRPDRSLAQTPLFQVMCVAQRVPDTLLTVPGVTVESVQVANGTSKFDLLVDIQERTSEIEASLEYNSDILGSGTCRRWIERLTMLLTAVCERPDLPVDAIPLVPSSELQLLDRWNATGRPRNPALTTPALFSKQAQATPDAIALSSRIGADDTSALTYQQLTDASDNIAAYLCALGVQPGQLVGLCVERSPALVVALLGILKAGAAYLPLDPSFPQARLAFMLEDSGTAVVVTDERSTHLIPEQITRVHLDRDADAIAGAARPAVWHAPAPDGLAYVLYTSGSTGRPKGVQITHGCLSNFLLSMQHTPGLTARDRLLAVTTVSFDIAGLELFLPLITGAAVVLATREQAGDPTELIRLIERSGITVLQATPATWRMLLDSGWRGSPTLRALCGGEAMTRDLANRLLSAAGEVWNLYGPTETTIWSTVERVQAGSDITIGRPIDNTEVYVLDAALNRTPIGAIGELVIGGDGVGLGYLNRRELTESRFLPDRFSGRMNGRLYRTGDLARFLPDGRLVCLGRMDHQVKIRGYRIELGEIESVLNAAPAIQQAVVVAREEPEDTRLVAYVVPRTNDDGVAEAGVTHWQAVWDNAYRDHDGSEDPTFDISGWRSSYSGQVLPSEEMREWVDHTVANIARLGAARILEIGCGTGLLLYRLAPSTSRYTAIDLSPSAIETLTQHTGRLGLSHVALHVAQADQAAALVEGQVDLVVINSVAQYFPTADYLTQVIERVLPLIAPGGHVFLGDIRNLDLLAPFHSSVALAQAPDDATMDDVLSRSLDRVSHEAELLLSPAFFDRLRLQMPAITAVAVSTKRGRSRNEMSMFRYDVSLEISGRAPAPVMAERIGARDLSLAEMRQRLEAPTASVVWFSDIADARTAPVLFASRVIDAGGARRAESLRHEVASISEGLDPEDVRDLARNGARVHLMPSALPGRYHAVFGNVSEHDAWSAREHRTGANADVAVANIPYRDHSALFSSLRELVAAYVPAYMVPSAFVVLDQLPLTPNGKVDRNALPAPPASAARASTERVVLPSSETEESLAGIWRDALGLTEISVNDNFFQIGGHSLAALRVFSAIESSMGLSLPLSALFKAPTIRGLALLIDERTRTDAPPHWPSVVVINDGSGPPLVGVHSLSGDVLEYRLIAKHLRPDQHVIGLQAPLGADVDIEAVFGTIEATAAHYVKELRRYQPKGPYYLCGWSSGGAIALEMAQQLKRMGCGVDLLAIIDSAPFNVDVPPRPVVSRLARQIANVPAWVRDDLFSTPPALMLARVRHRIRKAIRRVTGAASASPSVRDVVDFPARPSRWEQFADCHFKAFRRYTPSAYPGRVSLIVAPTQPLTWLNDAERSWRRLTSDVDVYTASGTHFSIVHEPNVMLLADALSRAITRVQPPDTTADG